MKFVDNFPIRVKLVLLAAVTTATALMLASAVFVVHNVVTVRQLIVASMTSQADIVSANTVAALTFDDREAATETLSSLRCAERVMSACIFDQDGRRFATFLRDPTLELPARPYQSVADKQHLEMRLPISDDDTVIGTLYLRVRLPTIPSLIGNVILMATPVFLAAMAISLFLSNYLQRVISGPISKLAVAATQVSAQRNYSIRVETTSADEIGLLYREFNNMLEQIQLGEVELKVAYELLEQRVEQRTIELVQSNASLQSEIEERKRTQDELKALENETLAMARQAGMAEIASSVLHNVGNVLNSVNVAASLVGNALRESEILQLARAVELVEANLDQLGDYITNDARGQHLPAFLVEVSRQLCDERTMMMDEMARLHKNIEHIKDIITLQQSHARVSGFTEEVALAELLDDAIQISASSHDQNAIKINRDYESVPAAILDKQKVMQILINLISNAKHAVANNALADGEVTARLRCSADGFATIEIIDNGAGIAAEHITKIFAHGFTTKKEGHGFGLHGSALYARELRGDLRVHSNGPGTGAVFTLELPLDERQEKSQAESLLANDA